MKFYIQVTDGYITDCIDYKHDGYIEVKSKENISIAGYMKYENGKISIDEEKKAIQEEEIRLAELEIEKQEEESKKNTIIDDMRKQLKSIESEALQNKLEWETSQHIEDEDLREAKLTKINLTGEDIRSRYNATIKFMREELGLSTDDIIG